MNIHCIHGENSKTLYESGGMTATSRVHSVLLYPEGTYVFCDASPFCPEDYPFPGQPGDTGELIIGARCYVVVCTNIFISESLTGRVVHPKDRTVMQRGLQSGYYKLHIGHFILDDGMCDMAYLNSSCIGETCLLTVQCRRRHGYE